MNQYQSLAYDSEGKEAAFLGKVTKLVFLVVYWKNIVYFLTLSGVFSDKKAEALERISRIPMIKI